jgi:unsaturated chondroitin disaccharide hydrolase
MLVLAYQLTKDEKYINLAKELDKTFFNRVDNMVGMGDHDIGFDFTLSTVATYKATGEDIYREKSIDAAKVLANRFREKGQFIQLWGDENVADKAMYRLIIDCLMNTQLLYWAGSVTGDSEFTRKGFAHFTTSMETVIREDGSSFQNFYFDPATGARLGGGTKQGLNAESCWSRGHSWAVTAIPFTYSYMKNEEIFDKYYKISDYFIDRLPTDKIAYWDLCFTDGGEARDSSANAIAVCGLLEAVKNMPIDEAKKAKYREAAEDMLYALVTDCASFDEPSCEGVIKHGTYYYAGGLGIDECCIWGDYFYMEALMRKLNPDWKKYW